MSRSSPSGKDLQAISTKDFTGGSMRRLAGHPEIVPTLPFQARAISRRNAVSAGCPHNIRYAMKRATTSSCTSEGEMLFAEQKRMNDDNRHRTKVLNLGLKLFPCGAQWGAMLGNSLLARQPQQRILALLLWFASVLAVWPAGTWCRLMRSARTAL